LALLKTREQNYVAYVEALNDATASHQKLATAIVYAREHLKALASSTNVLRTTLLDYVKKEGKIPNEDAKVAAAQASLKLKLADLTTWVTTCFGLTPEHFIDCVFNLAFVGSPLQQAQGGATEIAGHGAFTAFTTISSQGAKLIHTAVTT